MEGMMTATMTTHDHAEMAAAPAELRNPTHPHVAPASPEGLLK